MNKEKIKRLAAEGNLGTKNGSFVDLSKYITIPKGVKKVTKDKIEEILDE